MKVIVGLSGGVDSAVAAFLLRQQGFEVVGATFLLADNKLDVADARAVCGRLKIAHHVLDLTAEFRREVMGYFAREYARGKTPNPCVACNAAIKFGAFLKAADGLGCDKIATGHYASIERDEETGRFRVRRAAHLPKDQSYVLYKLTQRQLSRAVLPLGNLDKARVREIAAENDLIVAQKAESQDICFVPDGDYAAFLREYLGTRPEPGNFVDEAGLALGRHLGVWNYTVGQRKGLGLSLPAPMYVKSIDVEANTVTLAPNAALFAKNLTARDVNWIDFEKLEDSARFGVKIRYGASPAAALVTPIGDGRVSVVFDEAQRAITPGQSAVFYSGDYLAGGGTII